MRTIALVVVLFLSKPSFCQTLCDTSGHIWFVLEFPPNQSLNAEDIESKLNGVIDHASLKAYGAEFLYITFFIN